MKILLILMAILFAPVSSALNPRHMISIGKETFGGRGAFENLDTESDSKFSSVQYFLSDVALNYAYRVSSRIQIGAFYQSTHSRYFFKQRNTNNAPLETESFTYGLFTLYNFSDDVFNSWYTGVSFAFTSSEEENSHNFVTEENKAPFELDDKGEIYEIILGKRFQLTGLHLPNLSFAPQIKPYYRTHGKDFDDQKIGNGFGVAIQLLRFDLQF